MIENVCFDLAVSEILKTRDFLRIVVLINSIGKDIDRYVEYSVDSEKNLSDEENNAKNILCKSYLETKDIYCLRNLFDFCEFVASC